MKWKYIREPGLPSPSNHNKARLSHEGQDGNSSEISFERGSKARFSDVQIHEMEVLQILFPELGLRTDDTWLIAGHYKPILQEALRRLPKEEMDARNWRLARANQLVLQKSVLPREEWTDFDTDKPYLVPYIKEVEAEWAEKRDWDSKQ